ncbi:hypothetical protein C7M84_022481 [Penaeus vannamei]|uniref:Uncharacterized protein n=1 Tax=Penaeus vannamei TaxID=6689 RepID=A0A423U6J4_PENVA|nr:hypothetical protein C7M84_022481 [Penaeus vannamei]
MVLPPVFRPRRCLRLLALALPPPRVAAAGGGAASRSPSQVARFARAARSPAGSGPARPGPPSPRALRPPSARARPRRRPRLAGPPAAVPVPRSGARDQWPPPASPFCVARRGLLLCPPPRPLRSCPAFRFLAGRPSLRFSLPPDPLPRARPLAGAPWFPRVCRWAAAPPSFPSLVCGFPALFPGARPVLVALRAPPLLFLPLLPGPLRLRSVLFAVPRLLRCFRARLWAPCSLRVWRRGSVSSRPPPALVFAAPCPRVCAPVPRAPPVRGPPPGPCSPVAPRLLPLRVPACLCAARPSPRGPAPPRCLFSAPPAPVCSWARTTRPASALSARCAPSPAPAGSLPFPPADSRPACLGSPRPPPPLPGVPRPPGPLRRRSPFLLLLLSFLHLAPPLRGPVRRAAPVLRVALPAACPPPVPPLLCARLPPRDQPSDLTGPGSVRPSCWNREPKRRVASCRAYSFMASLKLQDSRLLSAQGCHARQTHGKPASGESRLNERERGPSKDWCDYGVFHGFVKEYDTSVLAVMCYEDDTSFWFFVLPGELVSGQGRPPLLSLCDDDAAVTAPLFLLDF